MAKRTMAPPPALLSSARTTTNSSNPTSASYIPPPPPIRSSALSPPPPSRTPSASKREAQPEAGLNGNAVALYDFVPQGEDELKVEEGDRLIVVKGGSDDPDWVKVRKVGSGEEGVVPASYVEVGAFVSWSSGRTIIGEKKDIDETFVFCFGLGCDSVMEGKGMMSPQERKKKTYQLEKKKKD